MAANCCCVAFGAGQSPNEIASSLREDALPSPIAVLGPRCSASARNIGVIVGWHIEGER